VTKTAGGPLTPKSSRVNKVKNLLRQWPRMSAIRGNFFDSLPMFSAHLYRR
jgi:hypothetical protein